MQRLVDGRDSHRVSDRTGGASRGWVRRWVAASAAAVALFAGAVAMADPAGDAALAKLDDAISRYKTLQVKYDVLNQEPGKPQNKLELMARVKAGGKQLTEILGPADVKGTKVLILSDDQMYVYLPAFGKVRRVASHVKDQGFMGTTFSQSDMALMSYGHLYEATIGSDGGSEMVLVLTPKAGATPPYAKIEMTVEKARMLPTKMKYFNASAQHVKTETRGNYKCEGNVCTPGEQKMTDHTKGDHWSKLVITSLKINPSLSDDVFSKRSLQE